MSLEGISDASVEESRPAEWAPVNCNFEAVDYKGKERTRPEEQKKNQKPNEGREPVSPFNRCDDALLAKGTPASHRVLRDAH